MNNNVMRRQYSRESCKRLSDLYLQWGCIPFDQMPYATSLIKHNPRIYDLFECINSSNREHEFLARTIQNSTDDDDDTSDAIVPFQVAYAVSIHKAQGLEYKSVKIVITNEVEELITHNIFYTAITRAKEDLKIYWTPETEKKILEGLSLRNYKKDAALLAAMQNL